MKIGLEIMELSCMKTRNLTNIKDSVMDIAQVSIPNLSSAIRRQMPADAAEITRLMRLGFDAHHSARAIWRLREGAALGAFSLVVEAEEAGRLLGSIRYWRISVGGVPSLLLGPLAVDPAVRGCGVGRALVRESLALAQQGAWHWCLVSGESGYYVPFGFESVTYADITLPAPIEEERLHLLPLAQANPATMPPKPWAILPSTASTASTEGAR